MCSPGVEPPTGPSGDEVVDRLALGAGGLLVGLAAAHVAYFLPTSIRALDDWRAGALWTLERDVEMTGVDAAFWALPGGFALPLGLLGLLVRRHARRGKPPPAWLGCGVGAWALIGYLISEPSGFPVGLLPAGMLLAASRRDRRAAHRTANTPRG
jgi:hypothetical protein